MEDIRDMAGFHDLHEFTTDPVAPHAAGSKVKEACDFSLFPAFATHIEFDAIHTCAQRCRRARDATADLVGIRECCTLLRLLHQMLVRFLTYLLHTPPDRTVREAYIRQIADDFFRLLIRC